MYWQTKLSIIVFGWILISGCASGPQPVAPANPLPTSAAAGETTIVAIAPPARQPPSLFDFLGFSQIGQGPLAGLVSRVGSRIRNRLGARFPGLEQRPPLLAITDPANLSEDSPPAVKSAAKIKQEEDSAPQKIKAVRYLASIGCGGCYPDVEEALLAALDDCTESVRYEAVTAMRKTSENSCQYCLKKACCSRKVQDKLRELTSKVDSAGCPTEASARVRRVARLALANCGPVATAPTPDAAPEEALPDEGPTEAIESGGLKDGSTTLATSQDLGGNNIASSTDGPPASSADSNVGISAKPD